MPPWYNPILSGHHIISKDGTDYLLIKVTDNQFITAQASSLISATILSPANFILLILIGLFFTWYLGKQLNSKREKLCPRNSN